MFAKSRPDHWIKICPKNMMVGLMEACGFDSFINRACTKHSTSTSDQLFCAFSREIYWTLQSRLLVTETHFILLTKWFYTEVIYSGDTFAALSKRWVSLIEILEVLEISLSRPKRLPRNTALFLFIYFRKNALCEMFMMAVFLIKHIYIVGILIERFGFRVLFLFCMS